MLPAAATTSPFSTLQVINHRPGGSARAAVALVLTGCASVARAEEEGTPKCDALGAEQMPLMPTVNSCYYDCKCPSRKLATVVLLSCVCFITVPRSPLHNADALLDGYSVSTAQLHSTVLWVFGEHCVLMPSGPFDKLESIVARLKNNHVVEIYAKKHSLGLVKSKKIIIFNTSLMIINVDK